MKPVFVVQDDSGHWYVIPFEMKDEFFADEISAEQDCWELWNEKYAQYMTGGDLNLVQLYAEI